MKIKLVLPIFFICNCAIQAQMFRDFNTGFKTIFINSLENNSYYFGHNPALLDFTSDDELLVLSSNINVDDGKFKKFIDPLSTRLYELKASGKKAIDHNQKFKGSFGFQRVEFRDWDWIFTRDFQTGNPFLIGDSTTGNSRINGIVMNAEYSNKLFEDFSVGVSVDYSVDEMLKEVSPRPTSKHRDIYARLGANYSVTPGLNFGVLAHMFDKNEVIMYREDEGSITQETIILKFKGYDFPNVFRKKTETRYSYNNGYLGGLTFSYISSEVISAIGYFNCGFDKTNVKDDALSPRAEGFWTNNRIEAGLLVTTAAIENIQCGITYKYNQDNGWAKYTPYNVLYYERKMDMHSLIAGLQYNFNPKISVGVEGGISLDVTDEKDHYSFVIDKINSNTFYSKIGFENEWNEYLATLISYGFIKKNSPKFDLISQSQSDYFEKHRKYDLQFLHTGFTEHEITLITKIIPWFEGSFYIYLRYASFVPESSTVFSNERKSQINSVIEYRAKVF